MEVPAAGKEFGYVDVYSSVAISATMPVGVICAADPVRGEELRPPRAPPAAPPPGCDEQILLAA